ncbi:right-handed parallel beta-helix repeat-containing protein [Candidatus Bipolaricaulota bacterium]
MKRLVMWFMTMALLVVPLASMAEGEAVEYDKIVLMIAEMAELTDQAIYLAVAGMSPYSRHDATLQAYGQGIVNLIQGPGSRNYDPTSEFTVREGSGIQPLLFALERIAPQASEFIADPAARSLPLMLSTIGRFIGLAGEVAEETAARPPVTYGDPDDLRTIYGCLLAARAGPDDVFLLGGVQTLVDWFPSRMVWAGEGETLQDVIDRVPEGGTIYLEPGTYRGPVDISKSVTIAAYSSGVSPAFGAVVIQGLPWNVAVDIESESPISVVLRDLEIYDGAAGVLAGGAVELLLENVVIRDCTQGLSVWEGASVSCVSTQFLRNRGAVFLSSDARCELTDCRIAETSQTAILLQADVSLTAVGCSILDGGSSGISVQDRVELHLEGMTIAGNAEYGLIVYTDTCVETGWMEVLAFTGTITGWGNTIPGPDEENGNLEGSICPAEYEFLLDAAPADDAETHD